LGFLRVVINGSVIVAESSIDDFIEFLESLVENIKKSNMMINRLIIDYVNYMDFREQY